MDRRAEFLSKANALKPKIHKKRVRSEGDCAHKPMTEGDSITLDFGNHHVGYVTLKLGYAGSHLYTEGLCGTHGG